MWPKPPHSTTEASTEVAQLRKIVIPGVQVVIGLSRMNEIQREMGSFKESMVVWKSITVGDNSGTGVK